MGRTKSKRDYWREYQYEIHLLRDGLTLRQVRGWTGRAIGTLRKLRVMFVG